MRIQHFEAVRFDGVLPKGRTSPMILSCRPVGGGPTAPKVVKAIGLPEINAKRQLVAEVFGNVIARRMGVSTAEPCIVHIDEGSARIANLSLQERGLAQRIESGPAAGCELLQPSPSPIAMDQRLTAIERNQAIWLYVFDMLTQNPDRRRDNVNCGLTTDGLLAFDFEMCFSHLFLPIIGGPGGPSWEPSKSLDAKLHLFHGVAREGAPTLEEVEASVRQLSQGWLGEALISLPEAWKSEGERIVAAVSEVVAHSVEFGKDILWSLK